MNKGNVVLSVLLAAMVAGGWISLGMNFRNDTKKYEQLVADADAYYTKGLYQKALDGYQQALQLREDADTRDKLLQAYEGSCQKGLTSRQDYAKALEAACDKNPSQAGYWERLLTLYWENGDYNTAYKKVLKCRRLGADSKKLRKICTDVTYSFQTDRSSYSDCKGSASGYYRVYDGESWGVLQPDGESLYDCEYLYAGPVSDDGEVLLVSEEEARVFDAAGEVQAIVKQKIESSHAYGEGMIPVETADGKWRYYSCDQEQFVLKTYDCAASFMEGVAAVKQEKQWQLIDLEGKPAAKQTFTDIKLYDNGSWMHDGIMIASEKENYGIYDARGKRRGDFSCRDADVYMGDYIAFADEKGRWGFVNKKGNIVIKPQFSEAKSFSNGMAAVSNGKAWGFIDRAGELVIDYQFDDAGYFSGEGACLVSTYEDAYYMIKRRFLP